MDQQYSSLNSFYKYFTALDDFYKYFIALDGFILTYLMIKSFPIVSSLTIKASFSILLVGITCMLIDNWNRKSIDYRLYVELYDNEYQANSDYKAGKIFINLIFYVLSLHIIHILL